MVHAEALSTLHPAAGATAAIVEFVGELRHAALPDEVRHYARRHLIDTVGVMIAGAGRLEAYALRASFTRASTAATPSPAGRTISGLISASAMLASSASRESATMACASASRSPAGLPR